MRINETRKYFPLHNKIFYEIILSLKYAHLPVKQNKRTQKLMMLYIKILYIVK